MLQQLVNLLKIELEKPLPGLAAQLKMAPDIRKDKIKYLNTDSAAKKGGVLILLYQDREGHISFPLIQRNVYDGVHSGQISLPGGKMEKGEGIYQTALRETHEEIGVDPNKIEVIGELTDFFVWVSNFQVKPVLGFMTETPIFIPDPHEVQRVIEVRISDFLRKDAVKKKEIRTTIGYTILSPYFDIDGHVIWGATAMMLSEFITIIRKLNFIKTE